jgi:hypothetical protein
LAFRTNKVNGYHVHRGLNVLNIDSSDGGRIMVDEGQGLLSFMGVDAAVIANEGIVCNVALACA